jgi:fluoroquinolone transport system permease protein
MSIARQVASLRALAAIDLQSTLGDPMLRWLAILPVGIALLVRFGLPLVLAQLSALLGADLGWLMPPLSAYINAALAPSMAGAVVGFLLLDQRDDRTLLALRVTPLPAGVLIGYRLALPLIVATLVAWAALLIAGSVGRPQLALACALAAAPLAPLSALALATLARNKVEGFALAKMASAFLIAPLALFFVPEPWRPALFLLPTTWGASAIWTLQGGAYPPLLLLGAWLVPGALVAALVWRFEQRSA